MLLSAGCEFFSTRTPEDPTGGSDSWQFPYTPETVATNLKVAIDSSNSDYYMESFLIAESDSADFIFDADPDAVADHPGVFEKWDIHQERRFIEVLFSKLPQDSLIELTVDLTEERPISGNYVELSTDYLLSAGLEADAPHRMKGRWDFGLKKAGNGGWYIERWQDHRNPDYSCWSDLKAYFW